MSYKFQSFPLKSFIEDRILLPRFQRKATWTDKQNFELAISLFQEYPMGVVVINVEKDSEKYLLDGRQRRNALRVMRDNPVALYTWARSFLKFKNNTDQKDINTSFWNHVGQYLSTDHDDSNIDDKEVEDIYDFSVDPSFDAERQRQGLKTLLDLIQMVHPIKKGRSCWERMFDFSDFIPRFTNMLSEGMNDPVVGLKNLLREFINKVNKYDCILKNPIKELQYKSFYEFISNRFKVENELGLEKYIINNWEYIQRSLEIIDREEKIYLTSEIGVILLSRATPLDAQNIFTRINTGGTKLKAEELLSAKPFWNEPVHLNSDTEVAAYIRTLYKNLQIPFNNQYVRWDLLATLLSRIDENHLIFDTFAAEKEKNNGVSISEIVLGFKLASSWYVGGMANSYVTKLESDKSLMKAIDDSMTSLATDVNELCKILFEDPLFQYLYSYKMPLTNLLGNAPSLEFVCILLKDWYAKGRSGKGLNELKRNAKILLDRLIYEYATKVWRGAGDSKMASDMQNWKKRLEPVPKEDWINFIAGACEGEVAGNITSQNILTPVLCYAYALNKQMAQGTYSFDVDHIFPRAKFAGNQMIDSKYEHSLTNLAFLPKKDNVAKNDKALEEILDPWLKHQITNYEYIEEKDFKKFSNIAAFKDLIALRKQKFIEIFSDCRMAALSN